MFDDLIIDRTKNDVDNKNEKGHWNIKDIDRINSYLNQLVTDLKLDINIEDFVLGEYITNIKIENLLHSIEKIRQTWYVAEDTPITPNTSYFNYNKANDIEKIIKDLMWFMYSYKNDKIYSGTIKSGEDNI